MTSRQMQGFRNLITHLKGSILSSLENPYDASELESYFNNIELKLELLRLEAKLEEAANGPDVTAQLLKDVAS